MVAKDNGFADVQTLNDKEEVIGVYGNIKGDILDGCIRCMGFIVWVPPRI